ncbi:YdcF family protein [Streptomyces bohaiensis]|uniref:YdcF family protein n=2 Tax=Streptomyces bohaiensis TaxID=1431344 RepID=A0ABX1CAI5_9ACTN|nr:YdcF family protein [Streptomyces bohaiensis]
MFRNAVLLGLVAISTAVALLFVRPRHAEFLLALFFLGTVLGGLLLAFFMVVNGLVMVRKEGRRPANLLSLLLGLAIASVLVLLEVLRQSGSQAAATVMGVLLLLSAYVAFLFVCFLGYAFLYGRVRVRGDVDFVVVLGCGLLGGDRVSPLLASRLEKGLELHARQVHRGGKPPVLLASGGQGADERVAESTAMARWLVDNGAPPSDVREEDRSRTTDENLRYSRTIMAADDPEYLCVVVTNNFHAFRAALTARRAGVNGQVLGSPTARYYWPSATIREFVAIMWQHRLLNLAMGVLLTGLAVLLSVPTWR